MAVMYAEVPRCCYITVDDCESSDSRNGEYILDQIFGLLGHIKGSEAARLLWWHKVCCAELIISNT